MSNNPQRFIAELARVHGRFAAVVVAAPASRIEGPSYCADWSFAQVCSHLGSGAEITELTVNAALAKAPAPQQAEYVAIWDRWNALSPGEMVVEAVRADAHFVEALQGVAPADLDDLSIDLSGRHFDARGLLSRRLFEQALHTWDLEVTVDDAATVAQSAVDLLIDGIAPNVGGLARGERPDGVPRKIAIGTVQPVRLFVVEITDLGVTCAPGDADDAAATVAIPSESFIRLVYGRLDSAHTPTSVDVSGDVSLDELRALFPGR